ncbi:MAG: CBS domain-containing protein [Candidatus Methanofastidiosa archaeon]|nr:CBS domain-containing protein [Candidatus Methanofastidiosa archaeon]
MKRALSDIAHKATTIDKDRRLSYAVELMEKENIARLPVTEEGELVGIITERDILEKIGSSRSLNFRTSSFHVSSSMTSDPFYLGESEKVIEAIVAFKEHGFSGIPILGSDIKIITKTDLMKVFEIPGYVSDKMNSTFHVVAPDDRVVHARRLLLDNNQHALPVWDGELVGLLTIQDIVFGMNEFREKTPGKYMESRLKEFIVEEIMSPDPKFARLEDKLEDIKKELIKGNFSSMPVLNFEDNIVGQISKDELVKCL